jgi:dTDP-4-amino-4,6-dideoxygalactose transaminase
MFILEGNLEIIGFNKPYLTGKETTYIIDAVTSGHISGNGKYTQLCQNFFQSRYGFNKCLLTSSCTDALEMAAILLGIETGDEVIIPSYTFVSTANAFVLRGAKIVFADSTSSNPNINVESLEELITPHTKAIVVVHYAGIACDMDSVLEIVKKHKLFLVEDAAQAIDSFFTGKDGIKKALGSLGHLATFSFHETKNLISGEGGMLVINDKQFEERAEIIWEKGTNRSAFSRGKISKYSWVDIGSSFLPSDIIAAFLYAQLENIQNIQDKRIAIWQQYFDGLKELQSAGLIKLPFVPQNATNNAHMFYIICKRPEERPLVIKHLAQCDIYAVFHYQSLHKSPFYLNDHDGRLLKEAESYTDTLLRLPMYYELRESDVNRVISNLKSYYNYI